MKEQAAEDKPHWSMDRRVPIALIVTIAIQSVTLVWWARGQVEKIDQHEDRINKLEATNISSRMSIIEYQQQEMKALLVKIDAKVDEALRGPPLRPR